jgi:hypothetical protein
MSTYPTSWRVRQACANGVSRGTTRRAKGVAESHASEKELCHPHGAVTGGKVAHCGLNSHGCIHHDLLNSSAGSTSVTNADAVVIRYLQRIVSGSAAKRKGLFHGLELRGSSPGRPGAGDPDTAALVRGIPGGTGHAGLQFREPVQAF